MTLEQTLKSVSEALAVSKKRNFEENVDLAINLKNLDMSKPQNRLDEEIYVPNGLGKPVKIAVFTRGETAQKAKSAGADYVFEQEEIAVLGEDVNRAKALADDCKFFIAEAQYMPTIGKVLGPILGPRGKMPIPLTPDKDIVQMINKSRNSIKVRSKDKLTFHVPVGRKNMPPEKIAENIEAILSRIEQRYEKGLQNVRSVYVKTTMGKAVKVI